MARFLDHRPRASLPAWPARCSTCTIGAWRTAVHSLHLALAFAARSHTRCVLWADLKPENVALRAGGEPVLLDFGAARVLPPDGRLETLCGTVEYCAPGVPHTHSIARQLGLQCGTPSCRDARAAGARLRGGLLGAGRAGVGDAQRRDALRRWQRGGGETARTHSGALACPYRG